MLTIGEFILIAFVIVLVANAIAKNKRIKAIEDYLEELSGSQEMKLLRGIQAAIDATAEDTAKQLTQRFKDILGGR